ncbi:hypothetical protein B0J17DRAFT_4489 [Rhizoctonia solani]|nr:hypothetical protein B0J17DRAFT_4489 [Rhizoctonia solani]
MYSHPSSTSRETIYDFTDAIPSGTTPQPTNTTPQPVKPALSQSSSSRPIIPIPIPPPSTLDKPIPNISRSNSTDPNAESSTEATAGGSKTTNAAPKVPGSQDINSKPDTSTDPTPTIIPKGPTDTKSTTPKANTPPTGPKAHRLSVGRKSATPPTGPRSATPKVSVPPVGPKALVAALPGKKAPPTGPRALVRAFGASSFNVSTTSSATAAPSTLLAPGLPSSGTTLAPGGNGTVSASTPQPVDCPTVTSRQAHTSQGKRFTLIGCDGAKFRLFYRRDAHRPSSEEGSGTSGFG